MRVKILNSLSELKLPRYKDLPDFGIYSEQLVEIVNKALEAMFDEDNKLTKSMVNNYVKHKIMPSPIKKRYFRNHIVYCLSLIHISEPTRLGMISYAVFCLKKKKKK